MGNSAMVRVQGCDNVMVKCGWVRWSDGESVWVAWWDDLLIELVLRPFAAHYGYVYTDDDNDDEIDRNPILHFKDKCSFTSHIAFDIRLWPHWVEGE